MFKGWVKQEAPQVERTVPTAAVLAAVGADEAAAAEPKPVARSNKVFVLPVVLVAGFAVAAGLAFNGSIATTSTPPAPDRAVNAIASKPLRLHVMGAPDGLVNATSKLSSVLQSKEFKKGAAAAGSVAALAAVTLFLGIRLAS